MVRHDNKKTKTESKTKQSLKIVHPSEVNNFFIIITINFYL